MPKLNRIDRLFHRFVSTSDALALGKVFDATAPDLLKIAAYLAGDQQQAEDLVQSTFLVAIERRGEFDTSRPAMPWLCGIVANLARAERRRARRPAASAAPSAGLDPVAVAEMAEFRAAFARARDALPEPYRPVLELYLEHGLRAHEIARVLDRPAGTVRAQITRGLDAMRKRLPRGFVAGTVLAAATPATLHAMRATILSQARMATAVPAVAGATAPWAAALLVGGIMNKKLIGGGVVASLLALGVWFIGGAPSGLDDNTPLTPHHALTASRDDAEDHTSVPEQIRKAVAPAAHASVATASYGRVDVTVRWMGTDAPAALQAVEVVCASGRLPELQPRRALTDEHGRCVIERIPAGSVLVFASTGDRAAASVEEGQTTTVALELESWGTVRGIVVDAYDHRVPGADIWVSSEVEYRPRDRGVGPGHGQFGGFTLVTDAKGRFETRLSRWQCLAAFKVGYGPSSTIYPCSGKAPANGIDVILRLAAEGSALAVTVRNALGAAVVGAQVVAGPELPHLLEDMTHATTPALRVNTDNSGLAELGPLPTGLLPLQVRAPGFAPWRGKQELLPGGKAHLVVRLQAAATVHGIALDSTGAPVAGALVWHGPATRLRSSQCTTDGAGRFELRDLPAGTLELTAWKGTVGLCRTKLLVDSGKRYAWQPQLSMRPAITGVVYDVTGQPAAGASVFCHDGASSNAQGKTGTDGRFSLGPLEQGHVYRVVAEVLHRDRGVARVIKNNVPPETDVILRAVLSVERTAHLHGRLLEPDGTPATQVQMTVRPVNGGMGHSMRIESTGKFATGPCRPGRVRITVSRRMKIVADLGEHDLAANRTVDLGDVYLPTPGGAVLQITGGNVVKGVATLFWGGQFIDRRRIHGAKIEWKELPPGDYRVSVQRGGATPFAGATAFAVASGTTVRANLRVLPAHHGKLRFVVDGKCQRHGTLIVEDNTGREVLRRSMAIPSAGKVARVLLPKGRLRFRFRTDDGWTGETRATVPSEAVIVLELSPR